MPAPRPNHDQVVLGGEQLEETGDLRAGSRSVRSRSPSPSPHAPAGADPHERRLPGAVLTRSERRPLLLHSQVHPVEGSWCVRNRFPHSVDHERRHGPTVVPPRPTPGSSTSATDGPEATVGSSPRRSAGAGLRGRSSTPVRLREGDPHPPSGDRSTIRDRDACCAPREPTRFTPSTRIARPGTCRGSAAPHRRVRTNDNDPHAGDRSRYPVADPQRPEERHGHLIQMDR